MARIRSVKPEYFTSMDICQLSIEARLAFIGLWTHADDEGRFVDEPRLIKAALFPLDDELDFAAVDGLLNELQRTERIIRYQSPDGKRFAAIRGWNHQKIDRRTPSKHPPPPDLDEGSSSARHNVSDDSSPDRIGSDRNGSDPSSSSEVTLTDDDAHAVDLVLQAIASHKLTQNPSVKNPHQWKRKVMRNDRAELTPRILELYREHPTAAASLLAGAVLGEHSALQNLALHRRPELQETPT